MLTLPVAARRIQRELAELEDTLNQAIARSAALSGSIALARTLPEISPAAAQESSVRLAQMHAQLIKCGTQAVRVHADLRKANDEVKAMPDDGGDCPWPVTPTGLEESLAA